MNLINGSTDCRSYGSLSEPVLDLSMDMKCSRLSSSMLITISLSHRYLVRNGMPPLDVPRLDRGIQVECIFSNLRRYLWVRAWGFIMINGTL